MVFYFYIYSMGCKKCKDKSNIENLMDSKYDKTQKKIMGFIIIWSGFAIYGIYHFIKLFV